jgi:hypothetical protein
MKRPNSAHPTTPRRARHARKPRPRKADIRLADVPQPDVYELGPHTVWIDDLKPSPENSGLYRTRTSETNSDRKRLVESIRKTKGIQAPLLVSRDGFIVSGHERWAASDEASCWNVPIIVLDLRRCEHTPDSWLAILREHNTGREKTLDERIREKIVDVKPDEAMRAVSDDQVERATPKTKTVTLPDEVKTRARITSQTRDFADAIKCILTGVLKDVRPVNERAIHYRLLPPLNVRTSRGKRGFVYGNNKRSSDALSRMLTRLRVCGEVPWEWICDETRPVRVCPTWPDAAEFLGEKMDRLYTGFARDLMQSQSAHYEIIIEKMTVKGFIDRVADRYTIPTVCLRGNSGIDARYQLAQRHLESGKKGLVLFVLTDCDPAGDTICTSTVQSLRDDFGITNVKAIRVAMTHAQADEQGVSQSLDVMLAKESSVTPKFIKLHGRSDCYELEAVSPEVLSRWLDEEIRGNIDIDAYNSEVEFQAADVAKIRATRTATLEVIRTSEATGDDADEQV